jgi:hypothetical protein
MIKKIAQQLAEMESMIPMANVQNADVSHASVGWHLAHNVLVINQVIAAVAQSDPATYRPKQTFKKWFVLLTKHIPRGKAKAPKYVEPSPELNLSEALERASIGLLNLMSVLPNQYFPHPFFGDLNRSHAIQFLWIHTEHHLKIAREILKK